MSINVYKNGEWKSAYLAIKGDGTIIPKIYYGDKLVLDNDGVVFESSEPGEYNVKIPYTGNYGIILVGAGSGGAYSYWDPGSHGCGGGSGAYVYGTIEVTAGRHTIVVGRGGSKGSRVYGAGTSVGAAGGDSSAFGQIAGGGTQTTASYSGGSPGSAGTAVTTVSYINGNSGTNGGVVYGTGSTGSGGSSVYGGYGAGGLGSYNSTNGGDGYVKIFAIRG